MGHLIAGIIGAALWKALESGWKLLRKRGRIKKIGHAGTYSHELNWKLRRPSREVKFLLETQNNPSPFYSFDCIEIFWRRIGWGSEEIGVRPFAPINLLLTDDLRPFADPDKTGVSGDNMPKFSLRNWEEFPSDAIKGNEPSLFFEFCKSDWYTLHPLQLQLKVVSPFPGSEPIEMWRHFGPRLLNDPIRYPNMCCSQVVLITSDDKVLGTIRSKNVVYYKSRISCSFEETLSCEKSDWEDIDKNPIEAAIRGFGEELLSEAEHKNVKVREYARPFVKNAKLLGSFIEAKWLAIGFTVLIETNIKSDELKKKMSEARDRTEREDWIFFYDYDLETLLNLVCRDKPEERFFWHPTSPIRIWHLLLHKWGAVKVSEAVEKLGLDEMPLNPYEEPRE